ncbi:hypothetical protein AB2M62_02020 [Sphingomonas sp. MMS12-HWE2-04]|uniref:hypothetical protein n=1 Tax=Sphingomonas sp. MMS12-HWE2-04 TaxID=3234199 RepID=UPI00384B1200
MILAFGQETGNGRESLPQHDDRRARDRRRNDGIAYPGPERRKGDRRADPR